MASVATQDDHSTALTPVCLSGPGCAAADAFMRFDPDRTGALCQERMTRQSVICRAMLSPLLLLQDTMGADDGC
jgi:hypothetical protein